MLQSIARSPQVSAEDPDGDTRAAAAAALERLGGPEGGAAQLAPGAERPSATHPARPSSGLEGVVASLLLQTYSAGAVSASLCTSV